MLRLKEKVLTVAEWVLRLNRKALEEGGEVVEIPGRNDDRPDYVIRFWVEKFRFNFIVHDLDTFLKNPIVNMALKARLIYHPGGGLDVSHRFWAHAIHPDNLKNATGSPLHPVESPIFQQVASRWGWCDEWKRITQEWFTSLDPAEWPNPIRFITATESGDTRTIIKERPVIGGAVIYTYVKPWHRERPGDILIPTQALDDEVAKIGALKFNRR